MERSLAWISQSFASAANHRSDMTDRQPRLKAMESTRRVTQGGSAVIGDGVAITTPPEFHSGASWATPDRP